MHRHQPSVAVAGRNGHDLFDAAAKGDLKQTKALLDAGANIEFQNNNRTPLMVASLTGQYDTVALLIERKADINAITPETHWSSLSIAAYNGHFKICELLLASKAAVDVVDSIGWTPLIAATHNGHTKIVKLLLKNKADVFQTTAQGLSAHIVARNEEYFDIAEILQLAEQRQRELFGDQREIDQNCEQGSKHPLLSPSDANPPGTNPGAANKQTLLKDVELANELTWQGASKGHLDSIYLGIDQGADPHYKGIHPYTSLEAAQLSGNRRSSSFLQAIAMYQTRKVKYWSPDDVLLFIEGTLPAHIGSTYIKAAILSHNSQHPYTYRYHDDSLFSPTTPQPRSEPHTVSFSHDGLNIPTYSSKQHPYLIVYNELVDQQRKEAERKLFESRSPESSSQRLSSTGSFEYASSLDQIDLFSGGDMTNNPASPLIVHAPSSPVNNPFSPAHPLSPTTIELQLQQRELPALHQRPLKDLVEIFDGPINGYVLMSPKFFTLVETFTTLTTEEKTALHNIALALRHGSPKPYRIKELLSQYANQFISTEHSLDLTSFHEVQIYLSVYKDIITRAHQLSSPPSLDQSVPMASPFLQINNTTPNSDPLSPKPTTPTPADLPQKIQPLIPILILDEQLDPTTAQPQDQSNPTTDSSNPQSQQVHQLPNSISSANGSRLGPAAAILAAHQRGSSGALFSGNTFIKHLGHQQSKQELAKFALRWWNLLDYEHVKCNQFPNCPRCAIPEYPALNDAQSQLTNSNPLSHHQHSSSITSIPSTLTIPMTPSRTPHHSGSQPLFPTSAQPTTNNPQSSQSASALVTSSTQQPSTSGSVMLPITLSTTTTTERRKVIKREGQQTHAHSRTPSHATTPVLSTPPPEPELGEQSNSETVLEIDANNNVSVTPHHQSRFAPHSNVLNQQCTHSHHHHHHNNFQKKTKTTTTTTTTTQVVGEVSSTYFHTRRMNTDPIPNILRHQQAVAFTQAYEHAVAQAHPSSPQSLTAVPQLHVKKSQDTSKPASSSSTSITCGFVLKNPDQVHKFRVNLLCDGLLSLPALSAAHRRSLFTCNQHHQGFSIQITNQQLIQFAPYLIYSTWLLALHQTVLRSFLSLRGRIDNYPIPSHFDPIEYLEQLRPINNDSSNNNNNNNRNGQSGTKTALSARNVVDQQLSQKSANGQHDMNFLGFPEGSNRFQNYVVKVLESHIVACQPSFIPPLDRNLFQLKSRFFSVPIDRLSPQPLPDSHKSKPFAYNFIPMVLPQRLLERVSAELKQDVQAAEREQEQLHNQPENQFSGAAAVRAQHPKSAAWRSLQQAMLKKKFSEQAEQAEASPSSKVTPLSNLVAVTEGGSESADVDRPGDKLKPITPTITTSAHMHPVTTTTLELPDLTRPVSSSSASSEMNHNQTVGVDFNILRANNPINNAAMSISSSDYAGSSTSAPHGPSTPRNKDGNKGVHDRDGDFVPMNSNNQIEAPRRESFGGGSERQSGSLDTSRLSVHQKNVLISTVKLMQSPSLNTRRASQANLSTPLPRSTSGSNVSGRLSGSELYPHTDLIQSTPTKSPLPPATLSTPNNQSGANPTPTSALQPPSFQRRASRTFDSFELLDGRMSHQINAMSKEQQHKLHHDSNSNPAHNRHQHGSSRSDQYKSHTKSRSTGLLLLGQRVLRDIEVVCEGNSLQLNLEIARLLGVLSSDTNQLTPSGSFDPSLLPSKRSLDSGGTGVEQGRDQGAIYSFEITWLAELHNAIERLGLQSFCPDVGNLTQMFSFFTTFLGQYNQILALQQLITPQFGPHSSSSSTIEEPPTALPPTTLTHSESSFNSNSAVPRDTDNTAHRLTAGTPTTALHNSASRGTKTYDFQTQSIPGSHNITTTTRTQQKNAVLITTVTTVDVIESDSSSSSDEEGASSDSDSDSSDDDGRLPVSTTTMTKTMTTTTTPLNQTTTTTLQRTLSTHKLNKALDANNNSNNDNNNDNNTTTPNPEDTNNTPQSPTNDQHKNKTKIKTSTTTVPLSTHISPVPSQTIPPQNTPISTTQLVLTPSTPLAPSFTGTDSHNQLSQFPQMHPQFTQPFLFAKALLFNLLATPPQPVSKSIFSSSKPVAPSQLNCWNPSKHFTAHLVLVSDKIVPNAHFMCEHHAFLALELDPARFTKETSLSHVQTQQTVQTTSLASALGFCDVGFDSDDEPSVVSSPKAKSSTTFNSKPAPTNNKPNTKATTTATTTATKGKGDKKDKDCSIM